MVILGRQLQPTTQEEETHKKKIEDKKELIGGHSAHARCLVAMVILKHKSTHGAGRYVIYLNFKETKGDGLNESDVINTR